MLQTFDGNLDHFDPRNPNAGDDRTPVQFYMGAWPDQTASEREGRPIYQDMEYIRIMTSKDAIIDRPLRDVDKTRWPRAYQAWKATGASEPGSAGTPLSAWPMMTRAQVEEYKYFKIYSVEQLAEAADSLGSPIMGFQKMKALAKAYVDVAKGQAPLVEMRKQLEERDGQIASLSDQINKLTEALEKLSTKVNKR
jgi:hypothetical protein